MNARDHMAIVTLGLFVVPAALVVYSAWFDGDVGHIIYSAVETLRGSSDPWFSDTLVAAGRFLVTWWWFIAVASLGVSTLFASFLAATDPHSTVAFKSLWVLSFFLVNLSVPVYCILQIGSRPNHSFKPTPLRDAA